MKFDPAATAALIPGLIDIGKFIEFGGDGYTLYSMGFADYKTALAGLPKLKEADADRAIAALSSLLKILYLLAANPKHSAVAMSFIASLTQ